MPDYTHPENRLQELPQTISKSSVSVDSLEKTEDLSVIFEKKEKSENKTSI